MNHLICLEKQLLINKIKNNEENSRFFDRFHFELMFYTPPRLELTTIIIKYGVRILWTKRQTKRHAKVCLFLFSTGGKDKMYPSLGVYIPPKIVLLCKAKNSKSPKMKNCHTPVGHRNSPADFAFSLFFLRKICYTVFYNGKISENPLQNR